MNVSYSFFCDPIAKGHSFFLKKDGKIFGFGVNRCHQLGVSSKRTDLDKPTHVLKNFFPAVKKIVLGYEHTVILTKDRECYCIGANFYGQFSSGTKNDYVRTPEKINIQKNSAIVDVKSGFYHIIYILHDSLWSCGHNSDGQLGIGHFKSIENAERMKFNVKNIKRIESGGYYVLILSRDGTLYKTGQLYNEKGYNIPTKITFSKNEKIINFFWGYYHYFAFTNTNKIYGCGWNEAKQISPFLKDSVYSLPTLITHLNIFNIQKMSLGWRHSLILMKNGEVFGSGDPEKFGCKGRDYDKKTGLYKIPVPIKCHHIQTSESISFMFGNDMNIYCAGSNGSGQLGLGNFIGVYKSIEKNKEIKLEELMKAYDHMELTIFESVKEKLWDIIIICYSE